MGVKSGDICRIVATTNNVCNVCVASFCIQRGCVRAFAVEFVLVISECDRETIFRIVTANVVKNWCVEMFDAVYKLAECDTRCECDCFKFGHNCYLLVL